MPVPMFSGCHSTTALNRGEHSHAITWNNLPKFGGPLIVLTTLSLSLATLFDTPFVFIYSSDMARGLLTDQAEAMGKVTIGGEFGHSAGVLHQGVQHAYHGIKNVLRHYKMLPGDIVKVDPTRGTPPRLVSAIRLDDYVPAPITGVYEPLSAEGAAVIAGEQVGWLYDFERVGESPLAVHAPSDGYLILQPFQAPVRKGDTMLVVAQEVMD